MLLPQSVLETVARELNEIETGYEATMNYADITWSEGYKEKYAEIKECLITEYTKLKIQEILKLLSRHDCVSFYSHGIDDDDMRIICSKTCGRLDELNETLIELCDYLWTFDPHNTENLGIEITASPTGMFIQFEIPLYSDIEGYWIIGESTALEDALKIVYNKYPQIKYYGFEGYVVDDPSGQYCSQNEFFSSNDAIPNPNEYIGELIGSSWDNDSIIDYFEENYYGDDISDEIKQLIAYTEIYKDYIGEENISDLKEAMEEYCSDCNDEDDENEDDEDYDE